MQPSELYRLSHIQTLLITLALGTQKTQKHTDGINLPVCSVPSVSKAATISQALSFIRRSGFQELHSKAEFGH